MPIHDAKSFAAVSRKLKRQHQAHPQVTFGVVLSRFQAISRPNADRRTLWPRVRILRATLGQEDNELGMALKCLAKAPTGGQDASAGAPSSSVYGTH